MDFFLGLPLGWAIAALFGGAMIRSNATYWLGRGVATGCRHTRLEKHLDGPLMRRAEAMMAKFGPFAVTLCFLTVGLQTAVIGSSGIARMPLRRFLPAVIAGSLLWAVLYATVGLAAIAAWFALILASPWAAAGAAVAIAVVVPLLVRRRQRAQRHQEADDGGALVGREHPVERLQAAADRDLLDRPRDPHAPARERDHTRRR
ncbi:VTT domain-containing protein [Arthrobacter sp. NPDC089319]|uniref:DedA family protein n=1 Tax=Arthrobacter sp. NPDC089319 TaxID=3155915 RepID=UPI003433EE8D